MLRPLAVIGDGEDDNLGQCIAPEDFQDLGFGEAGIIEGDFENLCVTGSDQGSPNTRWAAAGEGDSLSRRQFRQGRDDVTPPPLVYFPRQGKRPTKLDQDNHVNTTQKT